MCQRFSFEYLIGGSLYAFEFDRVESSGFYDQPAANSIYFSLITKLSVEKSLLFFLPEFDDSDHAVPSRLYLYICTTSRFLILFFVLSVSYFFCFSIVECDPKSGHYLIVLLKKN